MKNTQVTAQSVVPWEAGTLNKLKQLFAPKHTLVSVSQELSRLYDECQPTPELAARNWQAIKSLGANMTIRGDRRLIFRATPDRRARVRTPGLFKQAEDVGHAAFRRLHI